MKLALATLKLPDFLQDSECTAVISAALQAGSPLEVSRAGYCDVNSLIFLISEHSSFCVHEDHPGMPSAQFPSDNGRLGRGGLPYSFEFCWLVS